MGLVDFMEFIFFMEISTRLNMDLFFLKKIEHFKELTITGWEKPLIALEHIY